MLSVKTHKQEPELISYMTLRKAVGWLGVSLPAAMILGNLLFARCAYLQDSVSHYYFTITGSLFVGIVCSVGLFLITYKGYPRSIDNIVTSCGGIMAFLIALLPTNNDSAEPCVFIHWPDSSLRWWIHYISAAAFFIILAGTSLFLFTRSEGIKTPEKIIRNKIYRTCGVVMLLAIALVPLLKVLERWQIPLPSKPVFWLEWVALLAFGLSWLVKGELILKDRTADGPRIGRIR